jgi:hypothetical protein
MKVFCKVSNSQVDLTQIGEHWHCGACGWQFKEPDQNHVPEQEQKTKKK